VATIGRDRESLKGELAMRELSSELGLTIH
jgi:hypothetical protein